jgi:hypothetical protein
MPSPTIKGVTTIKWGTSARLPGAAFTNAVVMRFTITPKNGAPIEIEDNEGFAKVMVLIDDGFDAVAECLFDTAITWPSVGDTVQVKRPNPNAEAALNTLLTGIEQSSERKRETTITMRLSYRPGVSLV